MRNNDVTLIQRILSGDETAFASLVRKYQKQIHALAWRKIGDFHIAEDIIQEAFLQVYQKLETLEDPTKFPRWLYVIVDRLCIAWCRKNRLQTEPLEAPDTMETETEAYSRFVAIQNAQISTEARRDFVKNLLAKLQESSRIAITLHYFEGMTYAEIGNFLGVSEGTIKSRIRRARQQLKKYGLMMIQEGLDMTINKKAFTIDGKTLQSILYKVEFAPDTTKVSEEVRYFFLNGLYLDEVGVGATVRKQLSLAHCDPLKLSEDSRGFMVPLKILEEIERTFVNSSAVRISRIDDQMLFADEHTTLIFPISERCFSEASLTIPGVNA